MQTHHARATSEKEKTTVLVQLPGLHPAWPHIVEKFRELNWRLLDFRCFKDYDQQRTAYHGAIVSEIPTHPLVEELIQTGHHVVRVGFAPHPMDYIVPAVMPDWDAIGALAAEHFANRGFNQLGFVGIKAWEDISRQKMIYDGFHSRALQLGCSCDLLQ